MAILGFLVIFISFLGEPKKAEDFDLLKLFDPHVMVQPIRGDRTKHINRWGFRGDDIEKEKLSIPAGFFLWEVPRCLPTP